MAIGRGKKRCKSLLRDIKRVANILGRANGEKFSRSEYLQNGAKFTFYQIYDGGRNWSQLCSDAGFVTKEKEAVTDEDYFEKLLEAIRILGRYPKVSERKLYGLNFSKRRYPTLTHFIDKAIESGYVPNLRQNKVEQEIIGAEVNLPITLPQSHASSLRPVPAIPTKTRRTKWKRIPVHGLPYAPHDELSVVALFGILCSQGVINWDILEMNGGKGIDAICYDHNAGQEIRVELKHIFSSNSWNHLIEEIDYIVCWENRWPDFRKPVIELQNVIRDITSSALYAENITLKEHT